MLGCEGSLHLGGRGKGSRTRIIERILGNFHIEMAGFSQRIVTGLAATSVVPCREHFATKRARGRYREAIVVGVALKVPVCASAQSAAHGVAGAMDLTWLVVLSAGAAAVSLQMVAVLRCVTKEAK